MKSVCAALAVIIVLLATLSLGKISDEFLVHKLRLEESSCIDACVAAKQRVSSCDNFCNQAVTSANVVQRVVRAVEQEQVEQEQEESLSDFVGSEAVKEQNEATKHLWELFHTNMKSLLSNGLGAEGFQLLPNALEMSSIREFDVQHPSQLRHLPADDFDNPVILAREVMQATKPGPFRLTKGIRIIDEYRAFLSGVKGVKNVKHLNAKNSLAVKYGKMFAEAVSECARKYSSDMKMAMAFTFERYESLFCRNVADKKQMMYAQIGKEKAQQGNNPVYGAAVALGLAQEYTESTALTKLQSVRAMEFDCVQAQNGLATYRASPRQMQFAYNHRNWKNTEKTSSFSVSVGFSVFNAQYGKNDAKATGLDLTSVGGVSIAFADYKYIPLYPGTWYSPTAFKDFRYMPRENNKRSAIANFFGAQGTLRLFPKGLYVGVNPTIGFSVQNSKKTAFMKSTSTAISVGATVFGMNLGVNYNKGAKVEQGKESGGNTMVNIVSQSCIPQLFAVDYEHNY